MAEFYKLVRIDDDTSFLRRHKKSAAIAGALIVFVTFVTKEMVRDHLKEKLDSLQSAITIFDVRRDSMLSHSSLAVRRAESYEAIEKSRSISLNVSTGDSGLLTIELRNLRVLSGEIRRLNDTNSALLEEVPRDSKIQSFQSKFKVEEMTQSNSVRYCSVGLYSGDDVDIFSRDELKDKRRAVIDRCKGSASQTYDLFKSLLDRGDYARKRAVEVREKTKSQYQTVTWVSALLYVVGWATALMGRLFGAEEIAIDE